MAVTWVLPWYYHQSGDNTALRVGDTSSDSSKAGVFNNTITTETTPGSHGEGTAYCGRVFTFTNWSRPLYRISTGIGDWEEFDGTKYVALECRTKNISYHQESYCTLSDTSTGCPLEWGSIVSYNSYLPGCLNGTFYPNPTPASNTDLYTGSRTIYLQRTSSVHENSKHHSLLMGNSN